jgi:L-2-hydroxyglutarate oxidase
LPPTFPTSSSICDVLVIGGGIVGLATALRILQSRPQLRLVLLEKESQLACHQTGRNSGVIHSGLYYRPGSLKARNCRAGYDQLVAFCREEGIVHDICGKVVVATSTEELSLLATLFLKK